MSDQIPEIKVPFKASEPQFTPMDWKKFEIEALSPSVFGKLPWMVDMGQDETEAKRKLKVKEIQNKLSPDVPKLSDEFLEKVVVLSEELKCTPEDLLAIMYHESGGWDPSIVAKDKRGRVLYGGLIQMNNLSLKTVTNKYSKELKLKKNISMNEYLKLSREKQIDYAEGYFKLMKDSCNLDSKKHLTAGETWGMLKSPRQTKARNQRFLNSLTKHVENIKKKIFISTEGQNLNVKN